MCVKKKKKRKKNKRNAVRVWRIKKEGKKGKKEEEEMVSQLWGPIEPCVQTALEEVRPNI